MNENFIVIIKVNQIKSKKIIFLIIRNVVVIMTCNCIVSQVNCIQSYVKGKNSGHKFIIEVC